MPNDPDTIWSQASLLRERLDRVWDGSTSTDPDGWSASCPSYGHCTVAVLLVQDALGGKILRGEVGPASHFWNELPCGTEVDLTRDQFPVWHVESIEERSRQYVLSTIREDGTTTRARYAEVLRRLGATD